MNSILFKAWFGTMISLLSSLVPTWLLQDQYFVPQPVVAVVTKAPQIRSIRKIIPAIRPVPVQIQKVSQPSFLYSFTGMATDQGMPYASAKIVLWVTTPSGQQIHEIQTAADGSYNVTVPVIAKVNDPVDWEIKGQTADFKTVQHVGRQIVVNGENLVSIRTVLNFSAD